MSNCAEKKLFLYDTVKSEPRATVAKQINAYLVDAPNVIVESRTNSLCNVSEMQKGSIPVDGGNLILEENECADFIQREPQAKQYIRKLLGAEEFINNKERWCLWLVDVNPSELRKMPLVLERIEAVKKFRLASRKIATQKYAESPSRFMEVRHPETDYIIVPRVSSDRRKYIPIGFVRKEVISTDANMIISNATLYHFGILTSSVHMAWMRAVCGRLKSDYRYSKHIVYNNFPWPEVTEKQKAEIETLAQGVLNARAKFPESSLADLYDPLTMPPNLLKSHQQLDRAVQKLYGFGNDVLESTIIAALMQRYQLLCMKQETQ